MPIRQFKCTLCNEFFKSKKDAPEHCLGHPAELLLVAPTTKFLEKADPEKGKSALVDQQKILKERARKHSRDVDMDELIQNNKRDDAIKNGWVNDSGIKRRAIDDK